MDIKEKLLDYNLTEETYEELLNDIDKMKNGLMEKDWQSLIDKYDLPLNKDSLRKSMDCLGGYLATQYWKEKYSKNNNTYSDDETEKKLRSIFIETQKYRDIVAEYKQLQREESRAESMNEIIERAFDKRNDKKHLEFVHRNTPNNSKRKVLVAFADTHYGADFVIKGFFEEILNEYNPKVVKERFQELHNEIIEFCKLVNTNEIVIVDLGDSIEGALHISQLKAMKSDVVDDIIDYSDIIVDFVTSLTNNGLIIDMYTSEGNHSDLRLLTGKKGDFPHENLEKIYFRWLKKCTSNNPNITLHSNLDGINYFNVNGYNFLSAHGQNEKNVKNSIKEYEDTYGINIDYFLVGHLHSKHEIEVSKGKEVIQVRSVMGINEYSQQIKKTSSAGAIMFTVEEGKGKKIINEVKFN